MWNLIVSVPYHCLSFYFPGLKCYMHGNMTSSLFYLAGVEQILFS